jgi:hypothetical protein
MAASPLVAINALARLVSGFQLGPLRRASTNVQAQTLEQIEEKPVGYEQLIGPASGDRMH